MDAHKICLKDMQYVNQNGYLTGWLDDSIAFQYYPAGIINK